MGKFQSESVFIASIYPGDLQHGLSVGINPDPKSSRFTLYKLKGVPRGRPAKVIEIADAFENVLDPPASSESKRQVWNSRIVACERIAESLLKEWRDNMVGVPQGASRGILLLTGTVPTQAEAKQLQATQSAYAEYRFQEGEKANRANETASPESRLMAEWLGRKVIWSQPEIAGDTKECPKCITQISSRATVCPQCGSQIAASEKAALLPESVEEAVPAA